MSVLFMGRRRLADPVAGVKEESDEVRGLTAAIDP
jgi:hypothetical protein